MTLKKARNAKISYGKEVYELTSATISTGDLDYQQLRKALSVVAEELNLNIRTSYGTVSKENTHIEYDGWFRLEERGRKFHLHVTMFREPRQGQPYVGMNIDVRPESGVYESGKALYTVVGAIDRALHPEAHKKLSSTLRN